jgi:osmotically-inducible protein OsmY
MRRIALVFLPLVLAGSAAWAQMGQTNGPPPAGLPQPGAQIPGEQALGVPPINRAPGMGQHPEQTPNEPPAPALDDGTLQREVHEQLAQRSELAGVTAEVQNGAVTLTGAVPRKQDRKEARKLVESISGIRWVREKLSVGPAGAAAPTAMEADRAGQAGGTSVAAVNQSDRMAPEPDESALAKGATPPGGSAAPGAAPEPAADPAATADPGLATRIQNALRQDPPLAGDRISVSATDSEVVLTGAAATGREKQSAERIAQSFASNRRLVSRITVSGR